MRCHGSEETCKVFERSAIVDSNRKIIFQVNGTATECKPIQIWEEKCKEDLKIHYGNQSIVCCPPICTGKYSDLLTNITNSFKKKDKIWFFSEYNLFNHLKLLLGNKYNKVKKHNASVFSGHENNHDRFLLFDCKRNVVLFMHLTETEDSSSLQKVMQHATDEMKLFLSIYHRHCKGNISFVNVILAPNIENKICNQCLVIDKNAITSSEKFRSWWDKNICTGTNTESDMEQDSMTAMIACAFGFFTTKPNCYPNFQKLNDVTYLQLTYDQEQILMHQKKKKLIFGGYGSGKSILGKFLVISLL